MAISSWDTLAQHDTCFSEEECCGSIGTLLALLEGATSALGCNGWPSPLHIKAGFRSSKLAGLRFGSRPELPSTAGTLWHSMTYVTGKKNAVGTIAYP